MCCNPPARRAALLIAVLAASLLAAACGKKGDPLPPLRIVPQPTNDLRIRQQGTVILLEMSYPATSTSGLALGGIDAVELLEYVKPAAEGEPPPVDPREFEASAQTLLMLRGADLGATVTGDRIQIQLPLELPLPSPPKALYYAVRTVKGRETSSTSNRVALVPLPPPEPPSDLEVSASAEGVVLSWRFDGEAEGFDVFRREARDRGYGDPIGRAGGDERRFVDRSARYGRRYIYTVRTAKKRRPPVLSAEAGEREIDYQDRFPPPLPERFVALGERNAVRLRWDPSPADDLAGYVLYRREPGRDFHRLREELITGTEYLDRGLASGLSYDYRIQAVDRLGNASELSPPASATVR